MNQIETRCAGKTLPQTDSGCDMVKVRRKGVIGDMPFRKGGMATYYVKVGGREGDER